MIRTRSIAVSALAAAALSAALASPSFADCKTYGAIGTGVNEGMAKFMAEHGLQNVIDSKGAKATGTISYSCKAGMLVTECSARRQGCK